MTRLLVDAARYTVIRQNDGSIEIAPKDKPEGTHVFRRQAARYESELIAAYHRNGFIVSTGFAPGVSPMQQTGVAREAQDARKDILRGDEAMTPETAVDSPGAPQGL
jgi:hypothetical protein